MKSRPLLQSIKPSQRKLNKATKKVSISKNGIMDFATDEGYTPIDLVMKITGADSSAATNWLVDKLSLRTEVQIPTIHAVKRLNGTPSPTIEPSTKKTAAEMPWRKKEISAPSLKDALKIQTTILPPKGALAGLATFITETAYRPQPELALAAALCAVGTLAGRKYKSPSNLRTNLYIVSLADSGAGKNHSRTVLDHIFSDLIGCADKLGGNKIASGTGLLTALGRSPAILFQIDEFGTMLSAITNRNSSSRHVSEILDHMTELFTAASTVYRGIEFADQSARPRKEIQQPCLTIHGTTVPGHFWKSLESSNAVDGSLARFLVFQSSLNYPEPQEIDEKEPPGDLVELLKRIATPIGGEMKAALNGDHPPELMTVTYSPEGKELLVAVGKETDKRLRRAEGTQFTAFWARRREMVIKLAMIHAVGCDPENPVIHPYDVNFALGIVDRSIQFMIDGVERFVSDNHAENLAKRVIEVVRKSKGGVISKSELCKKTYWLGRDRDTVLKALVDSETLEAEIIETSTRPKMLYRIKGEAEAPP